MSKAKKANKKAYRNNRKKRKEDKKKEPSGQKLETLKRFSQFGSLTEYNMNQLYEQEGKAILADLINEGYIKKGNKEIRINKEKTSYFKLTTKGQKLIKEKGYKLYYSNSPRHDIIHATNVIEHFKDSLNYYKHEKELPESFFKSCSRVDGAIIYKDNTIYIETITRNYKEPKIQAKREYVKTYGAGCNCSYIEFNEKLKRR